MGLMATDAFSVFSSLGRANVNVLDEASKLVTVVNKSSTQRPKARPVGYIAAL